MTVLVDSSVLIHAQRLPHSEVSHAFRILLSTGEVAVTGPVMVEYIAGARSPRELEFLVQRVSTVDYLDPDRITWIIAARLSNRLMRAGSRITATDAAIAATAIRYDVPLYTLDKGFDRIPDLKLYQPPDVKETPSS